MFDSLSRVLLWLLVGTSLYFVIRSLTAKETFLGRVVVVMLLVFLLLAFILPTNGFVASIWSVISFPLKPLGASILLLFFATQKRKDILGRNLIVGAIMILLFASVPAFAFLLTRIPRIAVVQIERPGQEIVQNLDLAPTVAPVAQTQSADMSARLLYATPMERQSSDRLTLVSELNVGRADLTFDRQSLGVIPSPVDFYLLQVQAIPVRGLRPVDFVPSAEMLALSTRVWEQYLASVFLFLRNEQPIRVR